MQKTIYYLAGIILSVSSLGLASCEQNDPVPDYAYVGTATATIFTLTVSNDEPVAGEEITISANYVNQSEDPADELQTLVSVDEGDFAALVTTDESSAPTGSAVVRSISYQVPSVASGTTIVFDVLLNTQRMFPQRERVTIEVSE